MAFFWDFTSKHNSLYAKIMILLKNYFFFIGFMLKNTLLWLTKKYGFAVFRIEIKNTLLHLLNNYDFHQKNNIL